LNTDIAVTAHLISLAIHAPATPLIEPALPDMTAAFAARLASLVQCGVTIEARYGTSDPDNSCSARNPELTYAPGSSSFPAV
jgi:hypothetical protein